MVAHSPGPLRVAAVLAPVVLAALAALAHGLLANTGAALLLVLVVVAVAAAGDRAAGALAALSAALAFDFFLTAPYASLAIADRDEIEIAVLLLAVGLAVTEIAVRGRRHQEQAARRAAHLAGIAEAAGLASRSDGRGTPGDVVAGMIGEVLDLDACRHVADPEPDEQRPVLERDGTLRWAGRAVDVRRAGLPVTDEIALPAGQRGEAGVFLLTATSSVRRPDRERLLVAVTLAEQVPAGGAAPWAGSPRRREA